MPTAESMMKWRASWNSLLLGMSFVGVALAGLGCGATTGRRELEGVARNWSRMMRASQIIPVYPLTEDLRPGDIFLVETPLQRQASEYDGNGFLRLDQHLGRIATPNYDEFYGTSYGVKRGEWPPATWEEARSKLSAAERESLPLWPTAPRAAFPSYSFAIQQGGGANLGIPAKSVPVGLALMKAASATGSVTIAEAYTYGVTLDDLVEDVEGWYERPVNRDMVTQIRGRVADPIYLRVIGRVYLTRRIIVSMSQTQTQGATVSAGKSREVELLDANKQSAEAYVAARDKLNASLEGLVPGGTVKILQASDSHVSLAETFDRPLVVGYVSFDFPVDAEGQLGAPMATIMREVKHPRASVTLGGSTAAEVQLRRVRLDIDSHADTSFTRRAYAAAVKNLNDPVFTKAYSESGDANTFTGFGRLIREHLMGKPGEATRRRMVVALEYGLKKAMEE